ncbi:MAG: hypothetical protein IKP40_12810 [Clostridia bacterium]|nr:hypothetical protein [Clostridia bacterium]
MRRLMIVLLTLLCAAAFACASAEGGAGLLCADGAPLGTAVLLDVAGAKALLTAAPVADAAGLTVDGAAVDAAWRLGDTGLTLLMADGAALTPLPLASAGALPAKAVGWRADGGLLNVPVSRVAMVDGLVVLTADEGLLPGAALLTAEGELCGISQATLTEGTGRYLCLSATGVAEALLNAPRTALNGAPAEPDPGKTPAEPEPVTEPEPAPRDDAKPGFSQRGSGFPEGCNVRYEDGFLYVSWPASLDGCTILAGEENNQYVLVANYLHEEREAVFTAVPGRTYRVWVTTEVPDSFGFSLDDSCVLYIPDAEPISRYSYRNEALYLSLVSSAQLRQLSDAELAPRTETITREELRSKTLLLQAVSVYEVTEEIRETLTAVLFAPDGSSYATAPTSAFVYIPDIMGEDAWHMDLSDCVKTCDNWTSLPSGTYTVVYYINGETAGEVQFELE